MMPIVYIYLLFYLEIDEQFGITANKQIFKDGLIIVIIYAGYYAVTTGRRYHILGKYCLFDFLFHHMWRYLMYRYENIGVQGYPGVIRIGLTAPGRSLTYTDQPKKKALFSRSLRKQKFSNANFHGDFA